MVMGAWVSAPLERGYPRSLLALPRPPILDGLGRWPTTQAIAIVGSRAASAHAMATAHALAATAAGAGWAVVSGGALGIDRAAHRGALDGGGATVVVLGTGLDVLYPERNAALFGEVVAAGGALVSMFPRGAPPRAWHFVARNAVIAAAAELVVVVAAATRSGSLSTARAARVLGRRLAAVPGTAGTDALLASGALAIHDGDDLRAVLAGALPPPRPIALDGALAHLLAAVPTEGAPVAVLARAAGLRVGAADAMLAELVGLGLVAIDGERYRLR
jgi:DNA processing protein